MRGAVGASLTRALQWVVVVAACALVVAPFLWVDHPRQLDAPNHLARHWLAVTGDPALTRYWDVNWRLIPNLAGDLVSYGLLQVLPLVQAHRVAWAGAALGWVGAALALHRAWTGRWAAHPALAATVALNANLTLGFENYYLTAPFVLGCFAGWLALSRRSTAAATAFLLVASAAAYVGHLIAYGVLGVLVLSSAATRPDRPIADRARDAAVAGLAWGGGLVHLFASRVTASTTHGSGTVWATSLGGKLGTLLLAPVLTFDYGADLLQLAGVLGGLWFLVRRAGFRLAPGAGGVLVALAGVTLAMPTLLSGVGFSDVRLPPVFWLVALAAIEVPDPTRREAATFAVGAVALWTLRLSTLLPAWRAHDRAVDAMLAVTETVPPGAKVLPVFAPVHRVVGSNGRPEGEEWLLHLHSPAWLIPERRAYLPILFSGAHLVTLRPDVPGSPSAPFLFPADLVDDGAGSPGAVPPPSTPYWRGWRSRYDYLLVVGDGPVPASVLEGLGLVAEAGSSHLYRVGPR